jgi:hypothetical protein
MLRYLVALLPLCLPVGADDRVPKTAAGNPPMSGRAGKPRDLNGYFPMTVPPTKEAWETRRTQLRQQVLVATGLWPMPDRPPLRPMIHGKLDRDGYSIEKVFFASYPGHYVCGNLYRPTTARGKQAGILCPHGHWAEGRFHDERKARGEKYIENEIKSGAEQTPEGARFPLQAMCAQLARLGCVVFHYDMVGYADSRSIQHSQGFTDAQAELRLQSFMGLQTFNSIRALDFLTSLPDVDPTRIGVTGGSGGGTQTFILCAIDDRPAAAFPAVMVSTGMQGGCICENCSYLRIGAGNIDLAGLFAPKPLAMTGANDWTKEIETKGLPELKALYRLYDAEDRVMARCFPQFGHNFNQVSRELMYNWFNQHLRLGESGPIREKPFVPVPPEELSVFDDQHPMPKDAARAEDLRKTLAEMSDQQMARIYPKDGPTSEKFRHVVGTALRVMVGALPEAAEVREGPKEEKIGDIVLHHAVIGPKGENAAVPSVGVIPPGYNGTVVVWVHPKGKDSLFTEGKPVPAAQMLLGHKYAILGISCFRTGEALSNHNRSVDSRYAGYTFGYNRPLVAERVRDVMTAVTFAKTVLKAKTIHLVGWDEAGPWVILARALCGDSVARTAADVSGFRFDKVTTTSDEMMLPGALKYGGLPAVAALCAPGKLCLHNHSGAGIGRITKDAYAAAAAVDSLRLNSEKMKPEKLIEWLLQ